MCFAQSFEAAFCGKSAYRHKTFCEAAFFGVDMVHFPALAQSWHCPRLYLNPIFMWQEHNQGRTSQTDWQKNFDHDRQTWNDMDMRSVTGYSLSHTSLPICSNSTTATSSSACLANRLPMPIDQLIDQRNAMPLECASTSPRSCTLDLRISETTYHQLLPS